MDEPATLSSSKIISQRLRDLAQDEVVSSIHPRILAAGSWWPAEREWPEELSSGVLEPRRGYRFRPENVVLAQMLDGVSTNRVVDLGAGSGSLLIIAKYFLSPVKAVAIERQKGMVERLRRTLTAHELERTTVIEGDLRKPEIVAAARDRLDGLAGLVIANPPFFPAGWGRRSSNRSTGVSTHAEHGDVRDFCRAAAQLLAPQGILMFVYDAGRMAELLVAAAAHGFGPKRILFIPDQRPDREETPFRVWVEFGAEGIGASVETLAVV